MKQNNQTIPSQLRRTRRGATGVVSTALLSLAASAGAAVPFVTSVQPYAVSLSSEYQIVPLLSVGDRVPLTRNPESGLFQMIGVPDGLGAYKANGEVVLFMNHEVANTASNEAIIGAPNYLGAFVSRLVLNANAEVVSGDLAYDVIVDPAGNELPPARADNSTPKLVRLCSGTAAWLDAGFDRPIYFCGEENPAPVTFDGKGGLALAIVDRKAYTLPHLGHFQHENIPVRPHPVPQTVLVLMEDNGPAYDSQLYLYVGEKDFTPGAHPLARNGLIGGRVFVFAATTPGMVNEAAFQSGSIAGEWKELTGVASLNEAQLEAAADAVGAFGMIKGEDGAWSKRDKNEFFFNTTGDTLNPAVSPLGNHLGRTYRLNLNEDDITGPCTLTLLYNADQIYATGDIALTPDNLDASKDYLMVCEDGTGFSRNVMAGKGRSGLIWRYDLRNNYAPMPVVSLATPGRDGVTAGPGVWETSGILDAEHLYGRNSWLFNVQAHSPTPAPVPNTTEDGQLVLMLPVK